MLYEILLACCCIGILIEFMLIVLSCYRIKLLEEDYGKLLDRILRINARLDYVSEEEQT